MTNLLQSAIEMIQSPITWSIWSFIASVLLFFLLFEYIRRAAFGIIVGTVAMLFFYGVYIVSTTQVFDQTSIYVIVGLIIVLIIFMGFLTTILSYMIFFFLIGLSAYGSYTIIENCPIKEKTKEIVVESLNKSYNELKNNKKLEETTSNWKKFVF